MEKPYRRGIVFGKFLPPHKGHFWLFDAALEKCEHLTILVCALPDVVVDGKVTVQRDSIPGWQRQAWIKKAYADKPVEVILITEENPQKPDDHFMFWDIWAETIKIYGGRADAIFTSEEYGNQLSAVLGIPHEKIDGHRFKYNVSASQILTDPLRYWEFIPRDVTPYFTKRIAFVGPESVGKSEMAKQLSRKLDIPYVPEFGRQYIEDYLEAEDAIDVNDIAMISAEHQRRIWEISKGHKFVFLDTEGITTHLWCEFYCGPGSTPQSVLHRAWTERIDQYFVLLPTVKWVDDGTRLWGKQADRDRYTDQMISILDARKANVHLVKSPDFKERWKQVKTKIGEYWGKYSSGSQN